MQKIKNVPIGDRSLELLTYRHRKVPCKKCGKIFNKRTHTTKFCAKCRPRKANVTTILFLILSLMFISKSFAQELTNQELLSLLFGRAEGDILENKSRIAKALREELGATDEDLAFLFSIRAARLAYDGVDFLKDSSKFLQLTYLYIKAKEIWKKPITEEFYDFFVEYATKRTAAKNAKGEIISEKINLREFYQIEEAKKWFVVP